MPVINESAVTFTTLLVGLLTTSVLLLLPSTWQGDGRALRYWVIGNLALSLDRMHFLAPALMAMPALPAPVQQLSSACVVLGAGMHVAAMRLMLQPQRPPVSWHWPAALALAQLLVGWALRPLGLANVTVMAATCTCIVLMLTICWPQRRVLRGALLMSAAMVFFLGLNLSGLREVLQAEASPTPAPEPSSPLALLALDLVLSVVVNLAFLMTLIELLHQRIERLSATDPLTGVLNRRGFLQAANLQLLHADRMRNDHRAASVLLLDLDHFKRINDSLGHPMGDEVLRGAARRAAAGLRQTDVIARWGGEEFVVLLPGSTLPSAREVAERLRLAMAQEPLAPGAPIVTVSIGVAALDALLAIDQLPSLIAEADRRLYAAKRQRNCVVTHDRDADTDAAAARQAALPADSQGQAAPRQRCAAVA